jgi:hypothetical protein
MDFLKKHYEKVLLGVVLVGLAVAAAFLPFMIGSERETLKAKRDSILNPRVTPLPVLNLSTQEDLLKRLEAPLAADFSSTNKLFNPVQWQKTPDGRWIKIQNGNEIGPDACVVTNLTPLYLILTLDSVTVSDTGVRYFIGIENEAAARPTQRRKRQTTATLNAKNDTFTLREAKGPPENPTELVLEMNDSGERATLAKDRPFKRVDGYMADLKYPPENKTWASQRVGATLFFFGDVFTIRSINLVATNQYEVVLSAKSNGKNTARPFNRVP